MNDQGRRSTGSGGLSDPRWDQVDEYLARRLLPPDDALDAALEASAQAGLPPIQVSPLQGRLLTLVARLAGAREILEIGTLGGYSTICLARGLAPGGRVVTLERSRHHADVARRTLDLVGLSDRVEVVEGAALDTLPTLPDRGYGPFDMVFVDADKPANPLYLRHAIDLARPGAVVVVDNVVRHGTVADVDDTHPDVAGNQEMLNLVASSGALDATAVQTVGLKGYDGFLFGIVR